MLKKRILDSEFKSQVEKILDELKIDLCELHDVAVKDEKTGVYNYRFFKNFFEKEMDKARRGKENLSLIILDIDFFKKLNDNYGHLIGDKILTELAITLNKGIRKYDCLARFGGEEFLILLPGTSHNLATKVAERIRRSIIKDRKLSRYSVSVSLGVTGYKPRDSMDKMIKRADKALYMSKNQGRNKVSILL